MHTDTITTHIIVDYRKSLEAMIADGCYDQVNPDITPKRFPTTAAGTVQFETKVFHFDRNISSEDAVVAIKKEGFEPAKIEHLLAFGAIYPEEQHKYPIIGLGSVADVSGTRYAPYLYRYVAQRCLGLDWWGSVWYGNFRFLAVRKLSSAA
jgi:hypothetical protein